MRMADAQSRQITYLWRCLRNYRSQSDCVPYESHTQSVRTQHRSNATSGYREQSKMNVMVAPLSCVLVAPAPSHLWFFQSSTTFGQPFCWKKHCSFATVLYPVRECVIFHLFSLCLVVVQDANAKSAGDRHFCKSPKA